VITTEEIERESKKEKEKKAEQEKRRKLESRKLVAEAVSAIDTTVVVEEEDESGGATNAMPSDEDPTTAEGKELERDAWEIRELQRILEEEDRKLAAKKEEEEYNRRRNMTDEERMKEDITAGVYRKPGEDREKEGHYMQRFYHRGAFYMDEEEYEEGDVRFKAKDYARAATGEDKIDKSKLPEVMQVKKFGFARQNTKYKGLAKEDTTDRHMEMLPLVRKQTRRINKR
jgi:microfibrillar-associated protein 1